jgi:NAD(P) transhydrogenase subunit beta
MTPVVYYVLCGVLTLGVLVGIALMSKVRTAVTGNLLSALCMAAAIVLTLIHAGIFSKPSDLWLCLIVTAIGLVVGLLWAARIKMIEMPEIVALFNGFGGAASALVALATLIFLPRESMNLFALITGAIALAVGMITLTGSLIAGGKLHKIINGRPVIWKGHKLILNTTMVLVVVTMALIVFVSAIPMWLSCLLCTLLSAFFGVAFALRVGGADMPITISLLNSLSGVAGSIAGMAIGDPLLVAVGGVVGASGLLLTQIMCKAMNRHLGDILLGKTSAPAKKAAAPARKDAAPAPKPEAKPAPAPKAEKTPGEILAAAKRVIIVPGYGMALAQAQHQVKKLADTLEADGIDVEFAIHPVAGRMPGHMNVLLAEADVPYEKLHEMEEINPRFADCDAAIVIGANDVTNPAANTAEGTPIYGMPVLDVEKAKHIFICNYDLKPGYAGVENPIYTRKEGVTLMLGDAKKTVDELCAAYAAAKNAKPAAAAEPAKGEDPAAILREAKHVILIPGYGMALAQAQHLVKQLSEKLKAKGAEVEFAIHPVAGRMPGHMNVLLAEADVPYEELHEMEEINPRFEGCDAAVIIGASDVVNPAANTAEGTPIYGMPVLNAGAAKHIIVCNYDDKPGYAGVPNTLYDQPNTIMLLGDAKETVRKLIDAI